VTDDLVADGVATEAADRARDVVDAEGLAFGEAAGSLTSAFGVVTRVSQFATHEGSTATGSFASLGVDARGVVEGSLAGASVAVSAGAGSISIPRPDHTSGRVTSERVSSPAPRTFTHTPSAP